MTPESFKPRKDDPLYFRQDVYVVGLGTSSPINPVYCATMLTAQVLCGILADLKPKIVMASPLGEWPTANVFFQTELVPWLEFANGKRTNAGQLADSWTHGFPPDLVEQWTRAGLEVI